MNDSTLLDRLEAEAQDLAKSQSRIRVAIRVPYSTQYTILSQIATKYGVSATQLFNEDLRLALVRSDVMFVFPPRERAPEHVEFKYRTLAGLVRECSRAEGPLPDDLKTRLRESPALMYGLLEKCGCCGDLVRVSEATLNGSQALCPNCK